VEEDYQAIDADNHYYEPLDAFTRHLDRAYRRRGVQVVQSGRRMSLLADGRLLEFVPNPTFDPIIVPGCLDLQFRGQIPPGTDPRSLMQVEPLSPSYQQRDARLAVMDEQGLEAALLFPTLGCGVEEALTHDVDATMASLRAFNRWLQEDWGLSYRDRIITAPMLSLADPVEAAAEVDWMLDNGARLIHVRPAPVPGPNGTSRSLGDPLHDPVWARIAEAGVPVAFHLGDSGYNRYAAAWGGPERFVPFREVDVLAKVLVSDRAIHDTMASLIVGGVFTRHPLLRVASIENGSDWVHVLLKRLKKVANQAPWAFPTDPLDVVRTHVWIAPYYEEDIRALADTIGTGHVLFGSDWPHGEGLAQPLDFVKELHAFDAAEVRQILRDNVVAYLGRR